MTQPADPSGPAPRVRPSLATRRPARPAEEGGVAAGSSRPAAAPDERAAGTLRGPRIGGSRASLTERFGAAPPVPGIERLVFADPSSRLIAHLLDLVVLGLIGLVLAGTIGALLGGIVRNTITALDQVDLLALVIVFLLHLLLSAAYLIGSWSRGGRSLGMAILALRVVDEREAEEITLTEAAQRFVLLGIPSVLVVVWWYLPVAIGWLALIGGGILLGLLAATVLRDPVGQGYHDRIAGTVVVKPARRAR